VSAVETLILISIENAQYQKNIQYWGSEKRSQIHDTGGTGFITARIVFSSMAWWLSGSVPDWCPAVPGLNPVSPQPTADCQSSGGFPPGMALGCGLISMRGTEEKIMRNKPLVRQKRIKKKKVFSSSIRNAGRRDLNTRGRDKKV
jgi:hypothetical protein